MSIYHKLKMDTGLNLYSRICALNMEYLEGTCKANFGNGIKVERLGHPESVNDMTFSFDKCIVLFSPKSTYQYTDFYYTKYISAAQLVSGK